MSETKHLYNMQKRCPEQKFVNLANKFSGATIYQIRQKTYPNQKLQKIDLQGLVVQQVVTIPNNCPEHHFAEKVVQYFDLHICKANHPQ